MSEVEAFEYFRGIECWELLGKIAVMAILLENDEVRRCLEEVPGWAVLGKGIAKVFAFESYLEGIEFAKRCGEIAEEMNHHPDLLIRWKKVRVSIVTHSAGGLTGLDFQYAGRVDAL